jgi:Tol biopolymer transport system component
MTAFDGFDLVDARVVGALDEIAAATRPDYLDDIFTVTAQTRQRPRWTFFERWLPMDTTATQPVGRIRAPLRPIALLLILGLLAIVATAFIVGSQRHSLAPYGPAKNGVIAYGADGDLFVRDSLTGAPRLLAGGPDVQGGALFSRDGQLVAFDNVVGDVDHVMVAWADGSNPHSILAEPFLNPTAAWSPDSRSLALTNESPNGNRTLWIAPADGSGARQIDLGNLVPYDAIYNPSNDGTILLRADSVVDGTDLYLIDETGHTVRKYNLPGTMLYGAQWELAGAAFSPDGKTIAHNAVEDIPGDTARFRTYLVDVDGTNQRELPAPPDAPVNYSQAWPVFSPDGKWIIMESWVGAPGGPSTNQIAIVPADGSAPARGIGPSLVNQGLLRDWSPDGTKVLVGVIDVNDTYEVDPVSGEYSKLPWTGDMPSWQRTAR